MFSCYIEKNEVKKFSLDPGEELRGLTQIEEMLIAQIFPIVSIYCLYDGQYAYHGNMINFPQDVLEFATRLPHCPSSLDRCSSDGRVFRDFNVRRSVVSRALYWLKHNNCYYSNIAIDEEVLRSLPENGPLDDQIPRLKDIGGEMGGEIDGEIDEVNDSVHSNFSHPYS